MSNKTLIVIVACIALITGVGIGVLKAPKLSFSDESLKVNYLSLYPQARDIEPFYLSDHTGDEFTKQSLVNHWTLAFVGYTYCPDICPVTLAELSRAYQTLQSYEEQTPVQILFLSVDPQRDSIERLNEYMSYFNSDFIGATGPHKDLFPFVRNLGMMYSLGDSTDNPNYLVDHSASIVLINPEAQVIGRFKPQFTPGEMAISDIDMIVKDMPAILASR